MSGYENKNSGKSYSCKIAECGKKGKCVLSNNLDAIFSRTFAIPIVKDAFPGQFLSEGWGVDVCL